MAKIPITKKGYAALKAEFERLKKIERPKNIKEIEEARGHGDLSENAEYHAAKERQSHIDARIRDLEHKLAEAQIIDTSNLSTDKVVFGATVTVKDVQTEKEQRYTLVGPDEGDLKNGKISVQSPVGRALIGKRVGDTVEVKTPAKVVEYEVRNICFEDM
ncbi:MAG TPA: transcription elongation factor GreA [Nitrospiraceae bacterium]|jgi:transcription elongation factor GreA|nr:transcription elongation factor GreA [Nitrospiraceae bacterium]